MPAAQVATVANPLIDRLNALRVRRSSSYGAELDQIKFRAEGLRLVDRSSFIAMTGMMAVVEQDREALREAGEQLTREFPGDVHCHLNILRSYVALRLREDAKDLADRLTEMVDNVSDAASLVVCMLHNGDLEETASASVHFLEAETRTQDPSNTSIIVEVLEISRKLLESGFSSEALRGFLDSSLDALMSQGWGAPNLSMDVPFNDREIESPIAFARFIIDAGVDPELILDVEEELMDSLANDEIFKSAALCVCVMPWFPEA